MELNVYSERSPVLVQEVMKTNSAALDWLKAIHIPNILRVKDSCGSVTRVSRQSFQSEISVLLKSWEEFSSTLTLNTIPHQLTQWLNQSCKNVLSSFDYSPLATAPWHDFISCVVTLLENLCSDYVVLVEASACDKFQTLDWFQSSMENDGIPQLSFRNTISQIVPRTEEEISTLSTNSAEETCPSVHHMSIVCPVSESQQQTQPTILGGRNQMQDVSFVTTNDICFSSTGLNSGTQYKKRAKVGTQAQTGREQLRNSIQELSKALARESAENTRISLLADRIIQCHSDSDGIQFAPLQSDQQTAHLSSSSPLSLSPIRPFEFSSSHRIVKQGGTSDLRHRNFHRQNVKTVISTSTSPGASLDIDSNRTSASLMNVRTLMIKSAANCYFFARK